MRNVLLLAGISLTVSAQTNVPKTWDDKALEDWATPIAALGVRPGHFTAAEYYAVPADNLKTYPVYRPDKEPPGWVAAEAKALMPPPGNGLSGPPWPEIESIGRIQRYLSQNRKKLTSTALRA